MTRPTAAAPRTATPPTGGVPAAAPPRDVTRRVHPLAPLIAPAPHRGAPFVSPMRRAPGDGASWSGRRCPRGRTTSEWDYGGVRGDHDRRDRACRRPARYPVHGPCVGRAPEQPGTGRRDGVVEWMLARVDAVRLGRRQRDHRSRRPLPAARCTARRPGTARPADRPVARDVARGARVRRAGALGSRCQSRGRQSSKQGRLQRRQSGGGARVSRRPGGGSAP